jgi:Rrf2 family protein
MVLHGTESPVQIKDISKRQSISARYIEQIFQKVKKAGIIHSVRGPAGGYLLSKKPEEISVGDVVRAIDGKDIQLVSCVTAKKGAIKVCEKFGNCASARIWAEASRRLMDYFDSVTVQQICDDWGKE